MLPRKAILRTVTSSVALILFALTGRISDPELATLPASACPEEPGELRLLPNSKSCNVEVLVCEPLGLAYLHNYKSAGSSFIAQLSEFCRNATGESADRIAGWNRDAWQLYGNETGIGRLKGSPCDADLLCSSPGWTCYVGRRICERFK